MRWPNEKGGERLGYVMDVREIEIGRCISTQPAERGKRGGGRRTVCVKQACRTLIFIVLLE